MGKCRQRLGVHFLLLNEESGKVLDLGRELLKEYVALSQALL